MRDLIDARIGQVSDDAVEGVVGDCFGSGLLHPRIERRAKRLSFVLDREVDERCGSTKGRGTRAGLEVVSASGPAERHVEVGVNIDATRHHVFARRIENARGVLLRQVHADGMNLSIHDCDVGSVSIGRGNNSSVLDKSIKGHEVSGKAGNRRFYAMLPKFPAYH